MAYGLPGRGRNEFAVNLGGLSTNAVSPAVAYLQ